MKKVLAGYMFFMVFNISAFCQSPEEIDKSKNIFTQIFIDSANNVNSALHQEVWKLYTPSREYLKRLQKTGTYTDFNLKGRISSIEAGSIILKYTSETSAGVGPDSLWGFNTQLFTLLVSLPAWYLNNEPNSATRGLFLVECKKIIRWPKATYLQEYGVEYQEGAEKTYVITKIKNYKVPRI